MPTSPQKLPNNISVQTSNQVKQAQLKFTYLCQSMASLLDYFSQSRSSDSEDREKDDQQEEACNVPQVTKNLLTGIFVRNFTQHYKKFIDTFLVQVTDKLPQQEISDIRSIFEGVFNDVKSIGRSNQNSNNSIPQVTFKLRNELFSSKIESQKDGLKLQTLKQKLDEISKDWDIKQLQDINKRNLTGENINNRETYDLFDDPFGSPVVSPKKTAYIETLEYGHS